MTTSFFILAGAGLAVLLHRLTGLPIAAAIMVSALAASAAAQWRIHLARQAFDAERDRRWRDTLERNRQLARRIETLEQAMDTLVQRLDPATDARQKALTERMQGLEALIDRLEKHAAVKVPDGAGDAGNRENTERGALAEVHQALVDGRIDLHLQPIVALPQRHVKFYEGFTRLRRADGRLIMPAAFLAAARRAGLLQVIDTLLLFRCVEIIRQLARKNRRIGIFCNISTATLEDDKIFPDFMALVGRDPGLADAIVFELGLAEFAARSETARTNMARLHARGFRFSIDRADTLDLDLPTLRAAGIVFLKMDARSLLKALSGDGPSPLSALERPVGARDAHLVFRRHGIELIVDRAEDEKSVIELMEYGLRYGQGHLFGPPRPIKESLLAETTPAAEFVRRAKVA